MHLLFSFTYYFTFLTIAICSMCLPKQKWLYSYLLYSSNKITAQDHYVSLDLPAPVEDPVNDMYLKVNKHVRFLLKMQ